MPPLSPKSRTLLRNALIIAASVLVITFVFRLTEAAPFKEPTVTTSFGTMASLSQILAPLASGTYDSSAVVGDRNGNALQIAKCIIQKITQVGPPCP